MASKYYKGYKFVTGGKSRPGIIGVKPKSGGVVDEFKSKRLKELGKTQRKLKSQDKQVGEAIKGAQKKGLSRKDAVKGRKFQRDNRRAQREGDKLRKDVLRVGKARGGKVDDKKKTKKPLGGKLKKPKPGSQSYQQQEIMKPPYKRKEMERGGMARQMKPRDKRKPMESGDEGPRRKLKPVDPKTQKGLSKLPTKVRNKMGYMKDGGSVKTSKQEIFDIVDRRVKDKEASQKIKERLTNPDYFKKKKFGGGKK